ncbi:MAG: MFS transporter [Peptococcaceae bacterium]|nr:MFS transporter [Peptococcaceae bacterium]
MSDSSDRPGRRRGGNLPVLFLAGAGTVFDGANFAILLLFLAPLARYFHTSLLVLAVLQAVSYLAGIAGGLVFGVIADRWGRRAGLTLTVAAYSLFGLASAFSPDFAVLFVLRVLTGLAIGGETGIAYAYLNEARGASRRGAFSGLLQGMFPLGSFLATFLFVATSQRYGAEAWRYAFAYLGGAAVLAALIRFLLPESGTWLEYRRTRETQAAARSELGVLFAPDRRRPTLLLAGLMTFGFLGSTAVTTYAPAVWLTVYRVSVTTIGDLGYLGTLSIFLSFVLFGVLSDAWGRRRAFIVSAAVGTAGYAFYAWLVATGADRVSRAAPLGSAAFPAYLWMLFAAGYLGVQGVWMAEIFPTGVRATGINLSYYLGRGLGGGLAPLGALALVRALGFDLRWAVVAGLVGTLGAAVFAVFLPETRNAPLNARPAEAVETG